MTAQESALVFRGIATGLGSAVLEAVNETLETAHTGAVAHSQGGLSLDELRRLGHPFARRHGSILAPGQPDEINRQSGDFEGAWKTEDAALAGDEVNGAVVNESEHAHFLFDPRPGRWDGGTVLMFGRDIPAEVIREVAPRFRANMEIALAKLFGT